MPTQVALVVPIWLIGTPVSVTLPLNWTKAESFVHASLSARPRIQRR